ncbi:DAK2 domain-containing protein [Microbacterium limosum]|uniref:DAK2 domain-containing protein n=1 Tax=Microbacterium limosum TaxID=3079935 RepID=A0AAU0MFL9_9MICO|nr:DAK2 domain-containing protein [Microbacterium sp. Y20]WOQ69261.1 DAK2 domain-containing protein [Microbacterium sp. Y20]
MGGALPGMVFHGISRGCRGDDDLTLSQLAAAVRTASATVARRTGATLGQNRLLDAHLPADWALASAVCAGADGATALDQADRLAGATAPII